MMKNVTMHGMHDLPLDRGARLQAIDRTLGVQFRPLSAVMSQPDVRHADVAAAAPSGGTDTLEALKSRVIQEFPFTESLQGATQPVFGEGDPNARLVFVGEAPGADEDRTGRPFVGAAGQKLDQIIAAMGLSREAVYICNVLKARPPKNRTPLPDEVAANAPYLGEQLRLIAPDVIVALGGPAAKFLLNTETGITRLRGRWGAWTDPSGVSVPVMPTFHPAYLLRQYTPEVRGQMWADMQAVMDRLTPTANA